MKITTTFRSSTQSGMKYCQQSLTDPLIACRRVVQDANRKVGRIETIAASLRSRDGNWRPDIWVLQIEVDGPKKSRAEHQGFTLQSKKSRRGQNCRRSFWARVVQKQKAKKMPNTTPREETPSVAPQKATVHEEKHAHSSMTRARKAKGRNDLVPFSPAGSLHRNSKGDGKGNERWRKCWRHPKLVGKSPSGKANWRPCTNVKKGSCQGRSSCDYWHAPECTKFRAPGKCRFGDKWAHKHTAKPADEKKNSPLIAIHNPSDGERQVQLRKIQSNDTTQYRVRLHHGNKYVLKMDKLATCTWSHPGWISKDAKSKIFNIRGKIHRMDFEHGRKYKESSVDFWKRNVFWEST